MKVHDVTDSRGDVFRVMASNGDVVVWQLYQGDAAYVIGDVYMDPAIARQVAAKIIEVCDEMEKSEEVA